MIFYFWYLNKMTYLFILFEFFFFIYRIKEEHLWKVNHYKWNILFRNETLYRLSFIQFKRSCIRERGDRLNILSKQGTFNTIKQKYMDNPGVYLQYKEYPIEVIIEELGITKYELRKRMKQTSLQAKMEWTIVMRWYIELRIFWRTLWNGKVK